jgi:hypothetical protein
MNKCSLSNPHCLGEKVCSSPSLDVVIHYDVFSPILELTYKCGSFRHRFLVKRFYYSKAVLPVCYQDFLEFHFCSELEIEVEFCSPNNQGERGGEI